MVLRRLVTMTVAMVAITALAASPALAHFCYKTGWNEAAQQGAAGSQAWLTAEEWLAFLDFALEEGFICPEGAEILREAIEAAPDDALFMGPALLAGGNSPHGPAGGKGNNPEHFEYLPVAEAFEACGVVIDDH